ncbi:MAG: GyrI-like domain-containing protein [Bacteroidia bacterium]
MKLTPRIVQLPAKIVVGMHRRMSIEKNEIHLLWQAFMPRKKEIINNKNSFLFSLEVYDDLSFFYQFDPKNEFEKWAAMEVENFDDVPLQMEKLLIPEGLYAIFVFKGLTSDAYIFYTHIFTEWLPASGFDLELRPHFALMGEKYKKEDPNSEEEIFIPIKVRDTN